MSLNWFLPRAEVHCSHVRKHERGDFTKAYVHFHLTEPLPSEDNILGSSNGLRWCFYQNWNIYMHMDRLYQILSNISEMKIHAGRDHRRPMVQLSAQSRVGLGHCPAWSWKPQHTDGDRTITREKRKLRWLSSFAPVHKPAHQIAALLLLNRRNLLYFSFSFLHRLLMNEFTQEGNGRFTGARLWG